MFVRVIDRGLDDVSQSVVQQPAPRGPFYLDIFNRTLANYNILYTYLDFDKFTRYTICSIIYFELWNCHLNYNFFTGSNEIIVGMLSVTRIEWIT